MSSPRGASIAGNLAWSAATISAVSSTDKVVWVRNDRLLGPGGGSAATSATVSTKVIDPSGTWPNVPITSGWPTWPMNTMWRPDATSRSAWRWTLLTKGQVASRYDSPRSAALAGTALGTPCAENTTGTPSGTWSSSSTNTAPLAFRLSTTNLLWTISCLT